MKKLIMVLTVLTIALLSVNNVQAENVGCETKVTSTITDQYTTVFDFDIRVMKLESAETSKLDGAILYKFKDSYSDYKLSTYHYGIMQFEKKYGFKLTVDKEYFVTIKKGNYGLIIMNVESK